MSTLLPQSIADYLNGKNAKDFTLATSGFAADARVHDEGEDHVGPAAIAAWMASTSSKYNDHSELLSVEVEAGGESALIRARVSGTFDGSPIELNYRFTLVNGLITGLEIAS